MLVSAPTGSGKTVVADYAIARALDSGRRAFYTTPLKALSNQKLRELSGPYGSQNVGLLTGDVSHQPEAPVVVMTTEVLRNMLFSNPSGLERSRARRLGRGPLSPRSVSRFGVGGGADPLPARRRVRLSCLRRCRTPAELGAWMSEVRGPTEVIVETEASRRVAQPRRCHGALDALGASRAASVEGGGAPRRSRARP